MPLASINSTDPRTNPWNFQKKYWELAELENDLFLGGHFDFLFSKKKIFFCFILLKRPKAKVELVSKELNHFGVIACLFRQIGGHSSRFVLFCSFWRLFTIKMIKSVKVFPFSFWKIITKKIGHHLCIVHGHRILTTHSAYR